MGALDALRRRHLAENPACPYGEAAHYVPPGFGDIGFYACQPLAPCPDPAVHPQHIWGDVGQQHTCPGRREGAP